MTGGLDPEWLYVARFWSRVDITRGHKACWEWKGQVCQTTGYGEIIFLGKTERAHRISYRLASGETRPHPLVVRHLCHNKTCVNPYHLAVGDRQDNARDDLEAGKVRFGAHRWSAKYTDEQIDKIRSAASARAAAELVGCSVSYAYEVRRHRDVLRRAGPKRRRPDHQSTAREAMEGRR